MILGRNYRFAINNQAGVAVAVTLQARRWRFDATGALEWDAEAEVLNASGIASSATAWTTGAGIDNSGGKWLGADLELVVTPSASASGSVTLQIEHSTDGGGTWPTAGGGVVLGGATFSASAVAQTKSIRLE
ncbi:hypothetical protein GPA19_08030 [Azoarcus indigens]|uniref:Uncharacterized protein n=1 Tax=Azoarcus indigens TaxID=29545 RepID=A0A4R6DYK0_9RHOO|nr:hypothetical protein [Azoarcus indigens]NMG64892.1 hypothetical protein [Azoarcus indigens]TDN50430.1 hypothetical protein C7389_109124 [Azoarcus indigens]